MAQIVRMIEFDKHEQIVRDMAQEATRLKSIIDLLWLTGIEISEMHAQSVNENVSNWTQGEKDHREAEQAKKDIEGFLKLRVDSARNGVRIGQEGFQTYRLRGNKGSSETSTPRGGGGTKGRKKKVWKR